MANMKDQCIAYFDSIGYHYNLLESGLIKVVYSATEKHPETVVMADFEDAGYVYMYAKLTTIEKTNYAKAIILCNKLNDKRKWIRFSVDDNCTVWADMYLLLPNQNPGQVFRQYLEEWLLNSGARETSTFIELNNTTPFKELDSFVKFFEQ